MIRIIKWDFQEEFIEKVLAAVLRTPGLILCDYWHQQCLEYSFPKSFGYADVTDASLNSTVLILVRYLYISNELFRIFRLNKKMNEEIKLVFKFLKNKSIHIYSTEALSFNLIVQ